MACIRSSPGSAACEQDIFAGVGLGFGISVMQLFLMEQYARFCSEINNTPSYQRPLQSTMQQRLLLFANLYSGRLGMAVENATGAELNGKMGERVVLKHHVCKNCCILSRKRNNQEIFQSLALGHILLRF